jgi:carbonic anhydrase/acetyltransferase-like protein (isoleucine patch superfamily)
MRFRKLLTFLVIGAVICFCAGCTSTTSGEDSSALTAKKAASVRPNVKTTFNPTVDTPVIADDSFIDPMASVIGNAEIAPKVYVAPFASIRGDEGQPIYVGEGSNVQDGVVLHALETEDKGEAVDKNLVTYGGKKYAVYVGSNVSLAHQSQVHGPALVDDGTFVGMQALVFKAQVGKNCVIEPGAKLLNGVKVADGRYVPAGTVVTTQEQADNLPVITDTYPMRTLNAGVLHVNEQLAEGYLGKHEAKGEETKTQGETKQH